MNRSTAHSLLVLAAMFWGFGNVAQQTILQDLGPFTVVGLRCLIATLILAPFIRPTPKRQRDPQWLPGLLLVSSLFAAAMIVQQIAYLSTTVTNASFLVDSAAVLTPLVAWIVLRERPGSIVLFAGTMTLSGAFLMSGAGPSSFNRGDAWSLVSALLYGGWMVALGWYVQRHHQPVFVTCSQFAIAAAVSLGIGLATEPISSARLWGALPELAFLSIFSTVLAYGFQTLAQRHMDASTAAVIGAGESLFGAGAAMLLLGERLSFTGFVGAATIFAAILLTATAKPRPTPVNAAPLPNRMAPAPIRVADRSADPTLGEGEVAFDERG